MNALSAATVIVTALLPYSQEMHFIIAEIITCLN